MQVPRYVWKVYNSGPVLTEHRTCPATASAWGS